MTGEWTVIGAMAAIIVAAIGLTTLFRSEGKSIREDLKKELGAMEKRIKDNADAAHAQIGERITGLDNRVNSLHEDVREIRSAILNKK